MDTNTPEGIGGDDSPLSLDDAIKAYAAGSVDEVREDHPETEELEVDAEAELSDEEEEEDGDTQAEDHAEESEEGVDEETDSGRFVSDNGKVKLADGTITTIAELKRGNLREADYTVKTQALAETAKQTEEYRANLSQYEQQLANARDLTLQVMQTRMPQQPTLDMLQVDPLGYVEARARYDAEMADYQRIQQEMHQVREQQQQLAEKERQQQFAREWDTLRSKAPELNDPKQRDSFIGSLVSTAAEYGISQQDLESVPDHRLILVLRDLGKLKGLQAAAKNVVPKKIADKPPVQTGSKRLAPNEQRGRVAEAAMTRLKSSGSLKDGVAAYLATQKR